MAAGAPTLVASLWKVDEAATRELKRSFYARLLEGGALGDATAGGDAGRDGLDDPRGALDRAGVGGVCGVRAVSTGSKKQFSANAKIT